MKNGKRLTVAQRKHIESYGLNSGKWWITKCTSVEWVLIHKETGRTRSIPTP